MNIAPLSTALAAKDSQPLTKDSLALDKELTRKAVAGLFVTTIVNSCVVSILGRRLTRRIGGIWVTGMLVTSVSGMLVNSVRSFKKARNSRTSTEKALHYTTSLVSAISAVSIAYLAYAAVAAKIRDEASYSEEISASDCATIKSSLLPADAVERAQKVVGLDPNCPEHALMMIDPKFTMKELQAQGEKLYKHRYYGIMRTVHSDKVDQVDQVDQTDAQKHAAIQFTTARETLKALLAKHKDWGSKQGSIVMRALWSLFSLESEHDFEHTGFEHMNAQFEHMNAQFEHMFADFNRAFGEK